MKKKIFFVSSNSTWGGSEILWSDTAALLAKKGYAVKFAVRYKNPVVQELQSHGAAYIDLSSIDHPTLVDKILSKTGLKPHPFATAIIKDKPQLVIISQGNNVDGEYYMATCREHRIPYVTITQLVTHMLWTFIKDETIDKLRSVYADARVNYFVSKANCTMHQNMIGEVHQNSKIILNPFTVPQEVANEYPAVVNDQYHIALVGRLETYHKGHDLLIHVLQQPKWKERKAMFHFYGTGPHLLLLQRLVKMYGITNIVFNGHVQDVAEIWKTNHLLVLPSRMEGQSLALIEALWCFRAGVVTDVGGASEVIEDGETGFIAAQPTVSDIDSALERAWAVRHQWKDIGKKGGTRIREIYKENPIVLFSQEIENLFSEVTSV